LFWLHFDRTQQGYSSLIGEGLVTKEEYLVRSGDLCFPATMRVKPPLKIWALHYTRVSFLGKLYRDLDSSKKWNYK